MRSSSKGALLLVACAAVAGVAIEVAFAGTVQRPTTAKYDGPICFATVLPGVSGQLGTVLESRDNPLMAFATDERIFVRAEAGGLEIGREYLLYREEVQLEHPETKAPVGRVVSLLGRARVLDAQGDRTLAVISHACTEIEPGDRLHALVDAEIARPEQLPEYDSDRLVTPQPEDAMVIFGSGETVRSAQRDNERGSLNVRAMYGTGDVVTIDKGSLQGWVANTPVLFYRAAGLLGRGRPEAAEQAVVAQGVIFWAEATTAAVLVTAGDRALEVGAGAVRLR